MDSISCAFGFTLNRCSSIGHATVSTSETTSAAAIAITGVRHALRAAAARTLGLAAPSNAWERISHTPRNTPSIAVMAAMMNVTGMVACTVVYAAPVMRSPCWVRCVNTPITWRADQASMLRISQMPIWRRARLVTASTPRPCTGMVKRMPPIIACVTTENTMPISSSIDTADITSRKPGSTNT